MSNLMVKNRRTPLFIERKDALFIQEHFMNEKVGNDFKFKVNHAESNDPYAFSKMDIRDVFVNDDKDYWKLRNDLFPPERKQQIEPPMTPEELQRSREAMARVRQNLVNSGIISAK